MEKFNKFCEKYDTCLWQIAASIWFFVEYFCNREIYSLLGAGVFWVVLAILEAIKIKLGKK